MKEKAISPYWYKGQRQSEYERFQAKCQIVIDDLKDPSDAPYVLLGFWEAPPKGEAAITRAYHAMSRYIAGADDGKMAELTQTYEAALERFYSAEQRQPLSSAV